MRRLTIILGTLLLTACGSQPAATKTDGTKNADENAPIRDTLVMPTPTAAQMRVDTIDMGQIIEGESVTARFLIKNPGTTPLVIASAVTGCGCTNLKYDTAPLAPGDAKPATVTFDSKGRFGTQVKTLELITADRLTGVMILKCKVIGQ